MLVARAAVIMVAKLMSGTAIPVRYPNSSVTSFIGKPASKSRRGTMSKSRLAVSGSMILAKEIGMDNVKSRDKISLADSRGPS